MTSKIKGLIYRSEHGSMITLALVGIGVVSVIIWYLMTYFQAANRSRARANFYNLVSNIQLNIRDAVDSQAAWSATIADGTNNSQMACLATSSCGTVVNAPFILWAPDVTNYSNKSAAIYDGTDPAAGFTLTGAKCGSYSNLDGQGNTGCPIHVNLTWSTCPGCGVSVSADVQFNSGDPSPIGVVNNKNYQLTIAQVLVGASGQCAGDPPQAEVDLCANPPNPNDKLYCTPTGWKCGEIFY